MFDFLRKRALRPALTAKKRATGGDRNRRRTLFLEPLEERRLLAIDVSFVNTAFTEVEDGPVVSTDVVLALSGGDVVPAVDLMKEF